MDADKWMRNTWLVHAFCLVVEVLDPAELHH